MKVKIKLKAARSRGIYLLPNLITTGGLFAGFYAIVAAMRGDFNEAAIAIYIAMIMDTLDGQIARLTHTQSVFGAEYDSLSDVISFGIAPSLVVYSWGLISLGKPGWLVAFFYAAATALRLARFNANKVIADLPYFQGLPCTPAGGLIAGMVWVAHEYGVPGVQLWGLAAAVTILTSLLMVSTIPYYAFKNINFRGRVPFVTILIMVMGIVWISLDPAQVLLGISIIYVGSGPVHWLKKCLKRS